MMTVWLLSLVTISLITLSCIVVVESRTSFNIYVTSKRVGNMISPEVTVKAHLIKDLLLFLDLELEHSNFTVIAKELSSIPHRITVDIASATKTGKGPLDTFKWIHDYMPNTECMDYVPTYLFAFDREDILHEFGSKYFVLNPSSKLKPSREIYQEKNKGSNRPKQWLHVQQTGLSFRHTVTTLGFPDIDNEPCPVGAHCNMVALFRDPSQRLISWFYFTGEIQKCEVSEMRDASYTENKVELQKCFDQFLKNEYFQGDGHRKEPRNMFWGCQARMIVGSPCYDGDYLIPPQYSSDVNRFIGAAVERMRDEHTFAFIGNTEFFDASVTLSHQMLGRNLYFTQEFHWEEMQSMTGNPKLDHIQYESDFLCENNKLCDNGPDEAIFQETKRLMIFNLLKHHNNPVRLTKSSSLPRHPYAVPKKYNDAECLAPQAVTDRIRRRNKFVF